MSHAELPPDIYKWLVQMQVLPNTQKYKASGKYQLEYKLQEQLQCGFLVAKLLDLLARDKGASLNQQLMSSIKNSNTPAARVYNWNILAEGFLKLGFSLAKERQKQITSGGFDPLVLFLKQVLIRLNSKKIEKTVANGEAQSALDIKRVRKYQQINQSENILEIIIILISKAFSLNSKQAVATLAQSAKYLAHMIVKGVKGSYDEVEQFIKDSTQRMDKIMFLAEKDPQKNTQFLLQVFKPTLISRESEVVKNGTILFKALIYQSFKYNSKNLIYQILSKQDEGFDFIYMGIKRHPDLNFQIFNNFSLLFEGLLKDFFQIQLKKTINNQQQYLSTSIILLQPLLLNPTCKEQLFQKGLFQQWLSNFSNVATSKLKGKDVIAINQQTKYWYTELIYTLWMGCYRQMEPAQTQQILMKLTQQLKKNTRSEIYTIRIPSLLKMFNILQFLAQNKNKLAALLYKKIIFLFVQNHNQSQLRQIILQNMMTVLRKFPTIPLEFLLQPVLKQLTSKEGTSYILNMYDFQFILQLCIHPKMQEYYAITFLDYFIKLYTKSIIYSSLIFRVIQAITARFCQSEQIREYCIKSTDMSLNIYGMLVMAKTKGNKANYGRDKGMGREEVIMNNQKKSLIIELIRHYVSLQHKQMTQQIKNRVAALFVQWYQNKNHYDKGLAAILREIGDIDQIIINHKDKLPQYQHDNQGSKSPQLGFESPTLNGQSKVTQKGTRNQLQGQLQTALYEDLLNINNFNLGYKKNRDNQYKDLLPSRLKNMKPDPKTLEDIQKIKQKWKMDQSRAKQQIELQKKDKFDKIIKSNQNLLLHRNLSLGYAKLPNITSTDQLLFEFDSVKKTYLKDSLQVINLENQQEREIKSFENTIARYQKYLKAIFVKYANRSASSKQQLILSFTQIMRMLKQKNLLYKIPKISISEIISNINQKRKKDKNILSGIYEQDFPTFILYFTDLIVSMDPTSKRDLPIGLKVERVILKIMEGENNVKELFDPSIQKIKEEIEYNQEIIIPQEFKKVREPQIEMKYTINQDISNIGGTFIDCLEIVDQLVYQALGIHVITPITQIKQKLTIVKVNKILPKKQSASTDKQIGKAELKGQPSIFDKDLLADSNNSFTKPLKKLSKNLINKRTQSQRQMKVDDKNQTQMSKGQKTQKSERDRKRQLHAQKLKQQLLKLREQKQQIQAAKKQQNAAQEQKKKKKQQQRLKYLEENKRKIQKKKQQQQQKAKQNQRLEKQQKEKKKQDLKAKQAQLMERQMKHIQHKRQQALQKQKQKQMKQKQKQKIFKNKPDASLQEVKTIIADQKLKEAALKNSIDNGQLKVLVDKNKKNFQDLFQAYWNWEKQKIQLKSLAQLMKDFNTSKYISPKQIADVYKSLAKGQFLSLQQFIECIVRLAYRSKSIQDQVKIQNKKPEGAKQEIYINPLVLDFMLKLLKMNEPNYKQVIVKIKKQK